MSKTLEGMAREMFLAFDAAADSGAVTGPDKMKAALLWLADNVSDEMVWAYLSCKPTNPRNLHNAIRESISAALRAAAGSAPTTPEVK